MLSNIIGLLIFPLTAIIAFAHKYQPGTFEREFFSKRQTTILKGICICVVFLHHFSQICVDQEYIANAARVVKTAITLFFFLAGYTTALGHSRVNKLSLKKIWINRAWRLYLPIMIFSLPQNNFLTPLLIFFIATDLAFILFDDRRKRLAVICFVNIIYVIIFAAVGVPEYWWNDVLTYFVGVAFAMYKEPVLAILQEKTRYCVTAIILFLVCIPSGYLAFNYRYYGIMSIIFSSFSCLVVVMLMMKLNLKSRLFYFLGKYSWEIYLSHQMFMILLNKYVDRNSIVLVLGVLLSVLFSIIIQYLVKSLRAHTWLDLRKEVLQ